MDITNLAYGNLNNGQLFTSTGTWIPWIRPKTAGMIYLFCVGGGGGGGRTGGVGTARGGGGGGSAGCFGTFIIPACAVPGVLELSVGKGGAGGGAGQNGGAGTATYVYENRGYYTLLSVGPGGLAGNGGSTVAGGATSTPTRATSGQLSLLAMVSAAATNPQAGGAGTSVTGTISNITPLTDQPVGGGAGGGSISSGNVDYSSGKILADVYPELPASGTAVIGTSGYSILKPFYSTGGCGGGVDATDGGGCKGGDGGWGSGGGGGGAGSIGGAGGKGGDGIIIITTW